MDIFKDIAADLAEQLPGAEDSYITREVARAWRRFCIDSECWIETLAAVDSVADEKEYVLPVTSGQEIVSLPVLMVASADDIDGDPDYALADKNSYRIDRTSKTLILQYAPADDYTAGLLASVAVCENTDVTAFGNEDIALAYRKGILDAACARNKMLRAAFAVQWFDPSMAQWHEREYISECGRARSETYAGTEQNAAVRIFGL